MITRNHSLLKCFLLKSLTIKRLVLNLLIVGFLATTITINFSLVSWADDPKAIPPQITQYSTDITARVESHAVDAARNPLEPQVGVDYAAGELLRTFSTSSKSVCLVDAENRSTAILEALSERMRQGAVPAHLKQMRILRLDKTKLLASLKSREEYLEKIKNLLIALKSEKDRVLLFIDHLEDLVGAPKVSLEEVSKEDLRYVLVPHLADGSIRIIGGMSRDEFNKRISSNPEAKTVFQAIYVPELSLEEAEAYLLIKKAEIEKRHSISIPIDTIRAVVQLTKRYRADRPFVEEATDILNEAASRFIQEIKTDVLPHEIETLNSKLKLRKAELEALARDLSESAKARKLLLEKEMAALTLEVEKKQRELSQGRSLFEEYVATKRDVLTRQNAIAEYKRKSAEELRRIGRDSAGIEKIEAIVQSKLQRLEQLTAALHDLGLDVEVSRSHVAKVIADRTKVPLAKLTQSDVEAVLGLNVGLRKHVMGQDYAVDTVAEAVQIAKAGLADPDKPLGVFMFLGPTGVGKTELAKSLALELFGDKAAMTRFDMGEFMDRFQITRLTGSSPGYVGYEEGGQLTNAIRNKPFNIILFDEIEKAHPDIVNILMSLFDEGRLTDGHGQTVNARNTIIIMTSNLGALEAAAASTGQASLPEMQQAIILAAVQAHFRKPEFLNRIDRMIVFNSLGTKELRMIIEKIRKNLELRLEQHGLKIEIKDGAMDILVKAGYQPALGARELKRAFEQLVTAKLALPILKSQLPKEYASDHAGRPIVRIPHGSTIVVDWQGDDTLLFKLRHAKAETAGEEKTIMLADPVQVLFPKPVEKKDLSEHKTPNEEQETKVEVGSKAETKDAVGDAEAGTGLKTSSVPVGPSTAQASPSIEDLIRTVQQVAPGTSRELILKEYERVCASHLAKGDAAVASRPTTPPQGVPKEAEQKTTEGQK